MINKNKSSTNLQDRSLNITRVFETSREAAFQAWTDPERIKQWWGPHGFRATSFEMNRQPGGVWRVQMLSPEGKEHVQGGIVREIVEPEQLVLTFLADDDAAQKMLVSVTFLEQTDGRIQMLFSHGVFESADYCQSYKDGWNEAFDVLAEYLENVREPAILKRRATP